MGTGMCESGRPSRKTVPQLKWVYEKVVGKGKKKEYPLCKTKARKEQKGTPSTWRRAKEWKKCCCKKPKPECANCCKVCSRSRKEISRVWSSRSWQACSVLDEDGWSRCSVPLSQRPKSQQSAPGPVAMCSSWWDIDPGRC